MDSLDGSFRIPVHEEYRPTPNLQPRTDLLDLIGDNPGIRPIELARALGISRATMNVRLAKLENRGLIIQKPLTRKCVRVYLNRSGGGGIS